MPGTKRVLGQPAGLPATLYPLIPLRDKDLEPGAGFYLIWGRWGWGRMLERGEAEPDLPQAAGTQAWLVRVAGRGEGAAVRKCKLAKFNLGKEASPVVCLFKTLSSPQL